MSDSNDNLNSGEELKSEAQVSAVEPDTAGPEINEQPGFAEAELVSGVEQAKKTPVLLIAAIIVVVLAGAAAAAYNFIPFVKNNVKMLISKPEKYYAWVEEENLKSTADGISDAYGTALDASGKQNEAEIELKADINPENVAALIEELSGSSLDEIGVVLPSSISLKTGSAIDGSNISGGMQLNADGKSLATANVYMQDGKYFFQIPELSPAYISMDYEAMMNEAVSAAEDSVGSIGSSFAEGFMDGYMNTVTSLTSDPKALKDMLSEKELNELIVKYFSIVFENVEDVELEKGVSCEVNGEKVKYNKLAANIDQGTLYSICKDVLKEAKNDGTIIKIIEKFGLTKDDYTSAVDNVLDSLGTVEVSGGDTMFTMNVYVDSNGKILGRDIEVAGQDDVTISMMAAKKGSDEFIDIQFMSSGEGIKVAGKSSEKSGKESGEVKVSLIGIDGDGSTMEVPVSYKDFKIVNKDKGYCKGEFTVDLSASVGSSITLTLDSDGSGLTIKTDITVNGANYGTITLSSKEKNSVEIPAFDSSQKVYQFTTDGAELQQYLTDAADTLPAFIDNIGETFGVSGLGQIFGAALVGDSMGDSTDMLTDNDDFTMSDTNDGLINSPATEETKYDLSKVVIEVSGQTIPLPAKISGILDLVKVEDTQIEAGGFASYYSEDFGFGVNIKNDAAAPAAPADCTVTGLHTSEGAAVPVKIDGLSAGCNISDVAAKYGVKLTDPSSGYVTVTDTTSGWNTMTFYYYDGKVNSISITYYEY